MTDTKVLTEYRSAPGFEIRADGDDDPNGLLVVTFARFDEWTRISSYWEGTFLERVSRGAYLDTFAERGPAGSGMIRALFQHGRDPVVGKKPLGPVRSLDETDNGPQGVVALLGAQYAQDIREGVEAGVYGASYAFRATAEEWDDEPGRSEHNPEGLPERTITRAAVAEFGPVTFPADEGTNDAGMVGVRSLDHLFADQAQRREDPGPGAVGARRRLRTGTTADAQALHRHNQHRRLLARAAADHRKTTT